MVQTPTKMEELVIQVGKQSDYAIESKLSHTTITCIYSYRVCEGCAVESIHLRVPLEWFSTDNTLLYNSLSD